MTENKQIDEMMYAAAMKRRRHEAIPEDNMEKQYMNIETGSVDVYDGWWYDDNGVQVNAVDRGEVVAVELVDGEYQVVQ